MPAVDYHGQTTLITGASAGLGAEFARQLAARGSDLVLVARREERLVELAAELRAHHGIQVHVVAMDLAGGNPGQALAARVDLLGLHITSVINNAGFGTFGPFHQADPARLRQEIAVDVTAVADISRAFIERLRTAGRGVLVNVASMAAYQANPRMALYGATKAFVLSLTEALWEESRGTGLRVLALSPGATRTEFFDVVGTTRAAGGTRLASPVDVVRTALAALDRRNPPPSVIAGRMNRVMTTLARRLATRRQVIRTVGRLTAERA
ncbi:short-subunit dehydrogenase [Streptomyces griseochromogenes]|uniref:Oxidoreductase n=1 Tax=Streptomyces griseochromogenes TaxID=68214 RepID=A0A1B1AXH7_9ACTN|nr:SDR family oxidoreductase [Streptomyces griseochromogenes]ANP51231.1 oxidoreductase [Streptomyces griseochromogenes]MBP2050089.1 short-subunit dehydrogenase [Streptomyces griseochromogenes]